MKIKDDFIMRKVAGSFVVVPVNDMTLNFNGIVNLNETGAFLFSLLQHEISENELVLKLLDEYDVSEDLAKADVDMFISKLKGADMLE